MKTPNQQLYDPLLFDLTHRGNPGDLEFYLDLCQGQKTVLEYGCGSGRISLPLIGQGARVTGVDNHQGMLQLLQDALSTREPTERNNMSIIQGSMEANCVASNEKFDRILIPYNGLLCLLTDETVKRCFHNAATLLAKGGLFAFDIYHVPDDMKDLQWDEEHLNQHSFVMSLESDGRSIDIFEKQLPTNEWDRFDVSYLYRITDPTGQVVEEEYPILQRCMTRPKIEFLLTQCGFQVDTTLSDFKENQVSDDTTQMAFIAKCL